ncbi:MAG: hypothetical protein ACK4E7_13275 [Permianibacter sp.]
MDPVTNFVCEKCGAQAELRQEGSTQGIYCTKCDWAVVTTFIPEIKKDATKYEVRISGGDAHNEQQVKAVAAISGVNFLAAKKLLQELEPVVFAGRAVKVVEVRDVLEKAGITCRISPEFRY